MTEGQPLTNDDFRRLLATPRPERAGQAHNAEKPKRKKSVLGRDGGGKHAGERQDAMAAGYRDRAMERRQGAGPELAGVPEDLIGFMENTGQGTALHGVSYEESKYLGGDVAHTHLVKGLDYTLLGKIRAEEEQKAQQMREQQENESDSDREEGKMPAAPSVFRPRRLAPSGGRSRLAAAVQELLLHAEAPQGFASSVPSGEAGEMFQPRRMTFVYELDDDDGLSPVGCLPTTAVRAKEDCPKVVERIPGAADAKVLERVIKLLSYMSAGTGKVKSKAKKGVAPALTAEPAVPASFRLAGSLRSDNVVVEEEPLQEPLRDGNDDEGDIFETAGDDYKPERRKPDHEDESTHVPAASRPNYFRSGGGILDLLPPPVPAAAGADLAAQKMTDVQQEQVHDGVQPSAGPSMHYPDTDAQYPDTDTQYPDTNAQYPDTDAQYPSTDAQYPATETRDGAQEQGPIETGVDFYLNDEPDEEVKKRERAKERAKKLLMEEDDGYDYYDVGGGFGESDEEGGLEPVAAEEALDKGAQQRKAQRERVREAAKERSKLDSELGKIRNIMEQKGHAHANAFEKRSRNRSNKAADSQPSIGQKKRRI